MVKSVLLVKKIGAKVRWSVKEHLRCKRTHTEPNLWKLQGGEVGLEKTYKTRKKQKKVLDVKPLVPYLSKITPIV